MAGKKKSEIQELSEFIRDHMATKEDMRDLKSELKGDFAHLGEQVASIETDIRGMKRAQLEFRVADLEDKVFGKSRG
ncbi:MAG: hypothetical protein ABR929_14640 [Roseiarcus sp.]|jgi:hypothetical protein